MPRPLFCTPAEKELEFAIPLVSGEYISFNLLFGFINKNTNCKYCGGDISCLKRHQRGEVLQAI